MKRITRLSKRSVKHVTTLGLGLLALGLVAASPALAATASMAVSATVTSTCTIAAGPLAFGTYNPVDNSTLDGTATLTLLCTFGSTAIITMGEGLSRDDASTPGAPLRRMTDGTNFLSYQLFQEAERTTVWGNTPETGVEYEGTGLIDTTVQVYGQINSGQTSAPAGIYLDTVVATTNF